VEVTLDQKNRWQHLSGGVALAEFMHKWGHGMLQGLMGKALRARIPMASINEKLPVASHKTTLTL